MLLKIISISALFLILGKVQAQNSIPDPLLTSTRLNYIRTWIASAPDQSSSHLQTRQVNDVQQSTVYFDGFGRPIQNVLKQASPAGNLLPEKSDLVSANVYDPITGDEIYSYLPFAANNATAGNIVNDGNFKIDCFNEQVAFYNSYLTNQTGESSGSSISPNWAYSKTVFESSPLKRILSTYAPGISWVGTENTSKHGIHNKYFFNTTIDNVIKWDIGIWDINNPQINIIPTSSGAYLPNQLYKSIMIDEQNHQTIEFKDKFGQIVMRKVQISTANFDNGSGSAHLGWLCTYYVYDDFGNLRFVIPPKEVQIIDGTWVITPNQSDELCFRFEYDKENRLVVKKVPGTGIGIPSGNSGEVWMVYDQRDRIVMQQDGNLRSAQKWQYFQYDNLDREIATGIINDINSLAFHASLSSVSISYPNISNYTPEILTQSFFDDYASWMNLANSSTLTASLDVSLNGSGNAGFISPSNSIFPYPQPILKSNMTHGLQMGYKSELLDKSGNSYTVLFYDKNGQQIQVQTINITGGKNILTNQYDWSGKSIVTLVSSQNSSAGNNQTHNVLTVKSFDAMGRLLNISKSVNSVLPGGVTVNSGTKVISTFQYDETGKIKTKQLAPYFTNYKSTGLENFKYDYNIRGWELGMNRDFAKTPLASSNYFGYDFGYDKTVIQPTGGASIGSYANPTYFNGNINGNLWKSIGDGVARKYDFTYDFTSQLKSANFQQSSTINVWNSSQIDFSVPNISYDANSNITQLQQNGFLLGGSQQIDNLVYNYVDPTSSNKLKNVIDNSAYNSSNSNSVLGDFRYTGSKIASAVDYSYDANGNILIDNNRSANISYNYFNLPQLVTFSSKANSTISYLYDAMGSLNKKVVTDKTISGKTIITTYTYFAGLMFKSVSTLPTPAPTDYPDVLQFIGSEEGRIRFIPQTVSGSANYVFDYFARDHVGNVRMVLTDEIQQDIYPVATLEGTGGGTDPVLFEQSFYTINNSPAQVKLKTDILGYPTYVNKNGGSGPADPVQNNNPYCNNTSTIKQTDNSNRVYLLNGQNASTKYGLGITLKVMADDRIDVYGKSYWPSANTGGATANQPLIAENIIIGMFGAPGSPAALKGSANLLTSNTTYLNNIVTSFISPRSTNGTSTTPRAFINYIFFDDQLNYVGGDASPVSPSLNTLKDHYSADGKLQQIKAPKNGYIYIFCSNESPVNVYFDNLQVVLNHGPILEETHYYPFGLTMAGISSKASNKMRNFTRYNGKEFQEKEFSDGSGLEMYDYVYRFYDQQIGRFSGQDRLAAKYSYYSPYQFAGNRVPNAIDLDGLEPMGVISQQTELSSYGNKWGQSITNIYDPISILNGVSSDGKFSTMSYLNDPSHLYYWKFNNGKSGFLPAELKDAQGNWVGYWQRYLTAEQLDAKYGSEVADMLGQGLAVLIGIGTGIEAAAGMYDLAYSEVGFNIMAKLYKAAVPAGALGKKIATILDESGSLSMESSAISKVSSEIIYPPNNGFKYLLGHINFKEGAVVGRYGQFNPLGESRYFTVPGTLPELLSLPPHTDIGVYNLYRFKQPFRMELGPAVKWFDQPGGGMQFYSPNSTLQELLDLKILEPFK